jgi:hypothetical protein
MYEEGPQKVSNKNKKVLKSCPTIGSFWSISKCRDTERADSFEQTTTQ